MNYTNFNDACLETTKEQGLVVCKKQHDYGSNNILGCPVGPEMGLVVRLFDKLNRLANLYKQGKTPSNETLRDTWLDVAGYGTVGMMLCDGTFKLPLKESSGLSSSDIKVKE